MKKLVYKIKKMIGKFYLRSSEIRREELMDCQLYDEYQKEYDRAEKTIEWMYN